MDTYINMNKYKGKYKSKYNEQGILSGVVLVACRSRIESSLI